MKFTEIKDANGTTLQSYAELLTEKAKEAGFVTVIVLASKEKTMVHAISNIDGPLPLILQKLGRSMAANEPQTAGPDLLVPSPEAN